ncbi:hypothetical protein Patl1_25733 [Pistacia atlantica]|uniref:Uncharacterized protein n=1 Tax=Pistacia atlantica TaxID=434234 RepID=A0ACC1B2B2_9ROSI|nr:hypothetical protein Patl1_25733 [Pistacia atlantica]
MSWGVMAGHLGWGIIEEGWRKGPWTAEEDKLLIEYVRLHGEGRWNSVARLAELLMFLNRGKKLGQHILILVKNNNRGGSTPCLAAMRL